MKLKFYTRIALCLFFMIKSNAQTSGISSDAINLVDLTLSVKDAPSGQEFSLLADDLHNIQIVPYVNYNIRLNYQSQEDITSYFSIRCIFEDVTLSNPADPSNVVDPLFLGATAPVIIPPVKKKKTRQSLGDEETYPFLAKIVYRIYPKRYRVTIELLKYDSYQDYVDQSDNYAVSATKVIFLDATHNTPTGRSAVMTAFPNPSVNQLTIQYTSTTTNNTPLKVVIYDNKGVKKSQHTLTNLSTKTTSASYNLDLSHLQKGTYFVQCSYNGKTEVKTILKE